MQSQPHLCCMLSTIWKALATQVSTGLLICSHAADGLIASTPAADTADHITARSAVTSSLKEKISAGTSDLFTEEYASSIAHHQSAPEDLEDLDFLARTLGTVTSGPAPLYIAVLFRRAAHQRIRVNISRFRHLLIKIEHRLPKALLNLREGKHQRVGSSRSRCHGECLRANNLQMLSHIDFVKSRTFPNLSEMPVVYFQVLADIRLGVLRNIGFLEGLLDENDQVLESLETLLQNELCTTPQNPILHNLEDMNSAPNHNLMNLSAADPPWLDYIYNVSPRSLGNSWFLSVYAEFWQCLRMLFRKGIRSWWRMSSQRGDDTFAVWPWPH